MFLSLITFIACRAEMPESDVDLMVGHDPEYGTASVTITDDVPTDTGDSAEVEEDTAVEEVEQPCDGYELYVVGLSEDAIAQGYTIGVNCFPTRPTLGLMEDREDIYSFPFQDTPAAGWLIAAAPEGDVVVETIYGNVELQDDYGDWSENFDSVNELATRVFTYGCTGCGRDSYEQTMLGGNYPFYSAEGFSAGVGSYGDFTPITIPKGDWGTIWLQLDLRELPVTAGDSIVFEQLPVVTWHADGVPTVMTTENIEYHAGDNQYVVTYE